MDVRSVFIVIPVHNRSAFTRECLSALRLQSLIGSQTVVVDDGSSDATASMLAAEFPEVICLSGDGSLWWSGATNVGVEYALDHGAQVVICLNNDTIPAETFVERMVEAHLEVPDAIISAVALDDASGSLVYGGERMRWFSASSRSLLDELPLGEQHGRYAVTHCPGRGLLIPVSAFKSVGLFDERRFPQTLADYDYTLRAARKGYHLLVDYDVVLHVRPDESGGIKLVRSPSWRNYREHLFGLRGGGNIIRFVVFGWRNAPWFARVPYITLGVARRAGGYLLRWRENAGAVRPRPS